MEWAGFLLHLLVGQGRKVDSKSGSSRGILTQTFQCGESGNVEGRSLTQFRSYRSELTNFGDNF
jgi:hypothetical protein